MSTTMRQPQYDPDSLHHAGPDSGVLPAGGPDDQPDAPPSSGRVPTPPRTGPNSRDWQTALIELLARLEMHRLQLAGTRLGPDADFILDKAEQMVQWTEELAKGTQFADASSAAQMTAMAKAGAFYVTLNDSRRPASRSLFFSMISAFAANDDAGQTPAVRECLDQAVETLNAHFSLFTQHYPTSLAARGWVDAASAFLADFRQSLRDWPEA